MSTINREELAELKQLRDDIEAVAFATNSEEAMDNLSEIESDIAVSIAAYKAAQMTCEEELQPEGVTPVLGK